MYTCTCSLVLRLRFYCNVYKRVAINSSGVEPGNEAMYVYIGICLEFGNKTAVRILGARL